MGKKQPKAPNPKDVAASEFANQIGGAIGNTSMQMVSQHTPYGNLDYNVSGYTKWTDPNSGRVYDLPQYTATQTLSADGQAIFDQQKRADLNLATLSAEQSGRLGSLLAAPLNLNNEATESRLAELGRARLDPALADRRTARTTQLANQGISEGSAAYDRAMRGLAEYENDAYNQLFLQGRQQAVNEAITQRQQPINEILAIGSGTQLQSPQYVNPPVAKFGTPDIGGLIMQNYNNELNAYNQRQASLGGLFGTIASGIAMSDERVKRNIKNVGKLGPLNIVRFNYAFDPKSQEPRTGLIAQDVQKVIPDAVHDHAGLLAVDYPMIAQWAMANSIKPELFSETF